MPCLKLSKKYDFGTKKIEKQIKTAIHMDLWKYGQILIIQKSLTIKRLRFSKKRFLYEFIILYYIIYWVPKTNLECESILFFPFWDVLVRWPVHIFRFQKFITINKQIFLSINSHIVLFIMNLLVHIQVSISISKDIVITTSIWIMGTKGKNIVSSQKWAIISCIYLVSWKIHNLW
jgi:hypothetical protein